VVRVRTTENDKSVAARILREHGAVHMLYMGKRTWEAIGP
jgi:hypothetical protein